MVKTIPRILWHILVPTVETVGSFRFALMILCDKPIFAMNAASVRVPTHRNTIQERKRTVHKKLSAVPKFQFGKLIESLF
jgi:hypothetical protein